MHDESSYEYTGQFEKTWCFFGAPDGSKGGVLGKSAINTGVKIFCRGINTETVIMKTEE